MIALLHFKKRVVYRRSVWVPTYLRSKIVDLFIPIDNIFKNNYSNDHSLLNAHILPLRRAAW